MSESKSPPRHVPSIYDAKAFLKGLRSISLRNLTVRTLSTVSSGAKLDLCERDSASVTAASLPSLRAEIIGNGKGRAGGVLLSTGVARSTVNPTWPVSETAWLHAGVVAAELERIRSLLLRVVAVEEGSSGMGAALSLSTNPPRTNAAEQQALWECLIDIRGLTPLPAGSKLMHLRTLPADCLLVEMSNGDLYSPGWVVEALESNSALPPAVQGSAWGGGAADALRDDDDGDDDDEQEPLEVVYHRVLEMEQEAERSRAELSAMLENCWPAQQQAFQAKREDDAIAKLREELSLQEALLEAEEASLEREKRHLTREANAVEHLLDRIAAVEEEMARDASELRAERRETLKSQALLEARRARLTAELQAIYPIKYSEKSGEYAIRGLELPADLYSVDDERVSSALGYTAHLVCMLSKYLQVPLRYQLIYNASRSAVRDNVTGTGVAYPLFRRGVEKERFDRGVQLLSRDVEQLLMSRGVPVKRGGGQLLRNLERLMAVEGA